MSRRNRDLDEWRELGDGEVPPGDQYVALRLVCGRCHKTLATWGLSTAPGSTRDGVIGRMDGADAPIAKRSQVSGRFTFPHDCPNEGPTRPERIERLLRDSWAPGRRGEWPLEV